MIWRFAYGYLFFWHHIGYANIISWQNFISAGFQKSCILIRNCLIRWGANRGYLTGFLSGKNSNSLDAMSLLNFNLCGP